MKSRRFRREIDADSHFSSILTRRAVSAPIRARIAVSNDVHDVFSWTLALESYRALAAERDGGGGAWTVDGAAHAGVRKRESSCARRSASQEIASSTRGTPMSMRRPKRRELWERRLRDGAAADDGGCDALGDIRSSARGGRSPMGPVPHRPLTKRSLTWARAFGETRRGPGHTRLDQSNETHIQTHKQPAQHVTRAR